MRRQDRQNPIRPSERGSLLSGTGVDRLAVTGPRQMRFALAMLSLAFMFASRAALAEPNDLAMNIPQTAPPSTFAPAAEEDEDLFGSSSFPEASPQLTAPSSLEKPAAEASVAGPTRELGALLSVRPTPEARFSTDPDATIAAAVAEGTRPDLEPKKPFRKKSFDLFQTEREVEILRNEMLLRLRLRAKSRETMSVELRF